MSKEKVVINSKKGGACGEVENDTAYLSVLVANERGKGFGGRLLAAFEFLVRRRGASQVKVEVLTSPPGSGNPMTEDELRSFYEKNGYEADGYGVKKKIGNKK